jgi:site-specific recombinase XerD
VFPDTGLRLRELCNLKIRDLNFDLQVMKVMGKRKKEAAQRKDGCPSLR